VQSLGQCILTVGVLVVLASMISVPAAWGEGDVTCTDAGLCVNIAERPKRSAPITRLDGTSPRRETTGQAAENQRVREANKKFSAALAAYDRRLAAYRRCVLTFDPSLNSAGCGSPPTLPTVPTFGSDSFSGRGNQPNRITAGQAAATAVARLQLPTIAPGIGPSPALNPWNLAAVGYPLWLWADGPTHVGPISDSVAGLSVSLDAEVSSLTFRMGDGHTVTCPGTGQPWTTSVEPGTKSPDCGYSYAKPSLPDHAYTVAATANWAVTWTSNGQSGVINVSVVDTTQLPVGELQVLIR
jgi:hypothetical protein